MWGKLLTAVLTTFAGKIVAALGVSFVSYIGLNELQNYLLSTVQQQIGVYPKCIATCLYRRHRCMPELAIWHIRLYRFS